MTERDPLRIVHLVAPSRVGGLERIVQSLAAGQRARGHDVTVAAIVDPAERDHPFVTGVRGSGVAVELLLVPPRGYLRERRLVAELCHRLRPAIAHTHGYRPDVLDGPVARRSGAATVATVHGFTAGSLRNRFYEYMNRRVLRRADAVVTVSRVQIEQLAAAGVSADRLVQVPNAWTPGPPAITRPAARVELGLPADGFILGWVGRVSHEKGPDVFIDALARLRSQDWIAVVAGDGSDRAAMEERAAALGLGSRVRWLGVVPDAARLYRAFDVFVMSSRTEGIPVALFEAIAAEVPVVATRVGGVPEVVSDAEAILVPPDNPAELAAAIERVAAEPAVALERAVAARGVVATRFAPGPWLDRYDDVYRRAIARRQRS